MVDEIGQQVTKTVACATEVTLTIPDPIEAI